MRGFVDSGLNVALQTRMSNSKAKEARLTIRVSKRLVVAFHPDRVFEIAET